MFSNEAPNWAEVVSAVFSFAAVCALVLGAVQVRHVNQQMHRELEMQYLLRFWVLMDRRTQRFLRTGRPKSSDKLLMREYLGLSEDQCGLRGLGRVTDHTWSYWSHDIRSLCGTPVVKAELDAAGAGQFVHLRRLLVDVKYDPLQRGRVWRLWRGL